VPEAVYVFTALGGVGFVLALALGLAVASALTRFVLLVALGLALSLATERAGLGSDDCEGDCLGDFVRLTNLAGWGVGLALAGFLRWAYGRRSS
jgi:hypothetical protein